MMIVEQGQQFLDTGEPDRAIELLTPHVKQADTPEIFHVLAQAYAALEEREPAMIVLSLCNARFPGDATARQLRSMLDAAC